MREAQVQNWLRAAQMRELQESLLMLAENVAPDGTRGRVKPSVPQPNNRGDLCAVGQQSWSRPQTPIQPSDRDQGLDWLTNSEERAMEGGAGQQVQTASPERAGGADGAAHKGYLRGKGYRDGQGRGSGPFGGIRPRRRHRRGG